MDAPEDRCDPGWLVILVLAAVAGVVWWLYLTDELRVPEFAILFDV